jgi:hypothetical protein
MLKFRDEGVNVKVRHGHERAAQREDAGRILAPRRFGSGFDGQKKPRELRTGQSK